MAFWFRFCLNLSSLEVFSDPYCVVICDLPKFYQSLILAWRVVDGSYSAARSSVVTASGHAFATVSGVSAKSCYVYLLSECYSTPHCVLKFFHRIGDLHWTTTWHQLSLFSIDRPVIDLSWKIAHGVLYTATRLFSFGLNYVSCFCRLAPETPEHYFFHALSRFIWF